MTDDASAHPEFVPGVGDIVAVIVYSDGMGNDPNSIRETILEMKVLQTITNVAAATGGFGGVTVNSNQATATVSQVEQTLPRLTVKKCWFRIPIPGRSTCRLTERRRELVRMWGTTERPGPQLFRRECIV